MREMERQSTQQGTLLQGIEVRPGHTRHGSATGTGRTEQFAQERSHDEPFLEIGTESKAGKDCEQSGPDFARSWRVCAARLLVTDPVRGYRPLLSRESFPRILQPIR